MERPRDFTKNRIYDGDGNRDLMEKSLKITLGRYSVFVLP